MYPAIGNGQCSELCGQVCAEARRFRTRLYINHIYLQVYNVHNSKIMNLKHFLNGRNALLRSSVDSSCIRIVE